MLINLIEASIPLIGIQTQDIIYVGEILEALGSRFISITSGDISTRNKGYYYLLDGGKEIEPCQLSKIYLEAGEKNKTVIFVNPRPELSQHLANGGVLLPPQSMLEAMLPFGINIQACLKALAGLSLKDSREVIAVARVTGFKGLDDKILKARQMVRSGVLGVSLIDTDQLFYVEDKQLRKWVADIAPWVQDKNKYLQPRGLLLRGLPGVGKTEGSKYIAHQLGICLYRLDIAGLMNKFVGESERNLKLALDFLTHEAPCVVLIDEVEKLFRSKDDEGVSNNLLGQLLWWLQLHESPTITVMTCNDFEVIPKELYRKGRIDRVIELGLIEGEEQLENFLYAFCAQGLQLRGDVGMRITKGCYLKPPQSPADAVNAAVNEARKILKGELG